MVDTTHGLPVLFIVAGFTLVVSRYMSGRWCAATTDDPLKVTGGTLSRCTFEHAIHMTA